MWNTTEDRIPFQHIAVDSVDLIQTLSVQFQIIFSPQICKVNYAAQPERKSETKIRENKERSEKKENRHTSYRKRFKKYADKKETMSKNWKETSSNANHKNVKYQREKFRKEVKAAKNYASKFALEIEDTNTNSLII